MMSIRNAAVAFAVFAAGCASLAPPPPSSSLIGDWVVAEVNNAGVVERTLSVSFDETSRISGSAGCNRFTGAYSYDAGALTVTPLGVTRMMCAPALMSQEQKFITALQSATRVETSVDGATVLKSATGSVLLRRRSAVRAAAMQKAPPPPAPTATVATAPPASSSTAPYALSGGPAAPLPPYASAPPPETPAAPVAPGQVMATGELFFLERIALPPGAKVRLQLRDTSRVGAPSLVLAQQEFSAGTGGPYPFSISAPTNVVPANARLSIFAQIVSGARLLFITDTNYPVAANGQTTAMRIRLVNAAPTGVSPPPTTSIPAPLPAPAPQPTVQPAPVQPTQPPAPATLPAIVSESTGPAPTAYRCGQEIVRVAFDENTAWMTTADGVIAAPRVNPSDDPFAQRMYSNNRVTFIQDQDSGGGRVQFARGRMALQTCTKVR